jgi:hypothetical protein
MEGSGKLLITAVGTHSQTGIIMSLLHAADNKPKEVKEKAKKGSKLFIIFRIF